MTDKVVFDETDATAAALWAADCAERALPIWESEHPADDRPRLAIEAARWASPKKDVHAAHVGDERAAKDIAAAMKAAAGTLMAVLATEYDPARSRSCAVRDAATAAARAARVVGATTSADAWDCARLAATAAAWAVALEAARLKAATARAAGLVKWERIWDTAWQQAWDNERSWQNERLRSYVLPASENEFQQTP